MPGSDDLRFSLLRLLGSEPDLSQRDLSRRTGSSLGAVNYALRALGAAGLVKLERFRTATDKRRYSYLLTPSGVAEKARLAGAFLERKLAEYEALQAEIDRLREEAQEPTGEALHIGGGGIGEAA
jgi:EPS-associated MarR family transcriptional regulator